MWAWNFVNLTSGCTTLESCCGSCTNIRIRINSCIFNEKYPPMEIVMTSHVGIYAVIIRVGGTIFRSAGRSKNCCQVAESNQNASFPVVIQTASMSWFISNSIYWASRQCQAGVAFVSAQVRNLRVVVTADHDFKAMSELINNFSEGSVGRMCVKWANLELGTQPLPLSLPRDDGKTGENGARQYCSNGYCLW